MKRLLRSPLINWFTKLLRNSKYRWLVILGSVIYLVSPLDISPDVFPIIGWVDDGLLATIVVTELSQIALERRRSLQRKNSLRTEATSVETVVDVDAVTVA
ncbi:YkvA family protein [Leptolyngbya iicbica]|uniref:DUF1232 domain-containing protein n=2 Tax=Cyanophyceae TaxID=3028117 RepID=A0A4Q7E524_9CYAN|nr:YkvA family protein [Leptolyngbya sp. LK]RZM77237.1 DUF1232 domain-containing protein [Leptolyngbya sp. LK]